MSNKIESNQFLIEFSGYYIFKYPYGLKFDDLNKDQITVIKFYSKCPSGNRIDMIFRVPIVENFSFKDVINELIKVPKDRVKELKNF